MVIVRRVLTVPRPLCAVLYVVCVKWTWKLLSCYIVTTLSTLSHGVFELMNRCEDDDVVMEFWTHSSLLGIFHILKCKLPVQWGLFCLLSEVSVKIEIFAFIKWNSDVQIFHRIVTSDGRFLLVWNIWHLDIWLEDRRIEIQTVRFLCSLCSHGSAEWPVF